MLLLSFWVIFEMEKVQQHFVRLCKILILNCCSGLFLVALLALSVTDFTHVDSNSVCAVPTSMQLWSCLLFLFCFIADHGSLVLVVLNRKNSQPYLTDNEWILTTITPTNAALMMSRNNYSLKRYWTMPKCLPTAHAVRRNALEFSL